MEAGVDGGLLPPLELFAPELAPPPQPVKLTATKMTDGEREQSFALSARRMVLRAQPRTVWLLKLVWRSSAAAGYWTKGKKKGRRRAGNRIMRVRVNPLIRDTSSAD